MRCGSSPARCVSWASPPRSWPAACALYVNGETATYWTTPDGNQVEVVLRLNEGQRERIAQLRQLPVAFAKDGTPIPLDAVADITEVFNPEVIRRQNLQRREAVFAGVKDRSPGEVGDDVQALIKATMRCRRATASTWAARCSSRPRPSAACWARWRWR